jgi:hypothetical protein
MNAFDRGRDGECLGFRHPEQSGRFDDQERAKTLAAAKGGITHRVGE